MAKPLDPVVSEILKTYGLQPKDALWDCHGTWVMYHRVLEQAAVKAGITFKPPQVLEADGIAKSVALCVTGEAANGYSEWSIGEASPANCKNAYPYAMAEKRAKDRVILKLMGLHGFIYSEDEFEHQEQAPAPAPVPAPLSELPAAKAMEYLIGDIGGCVTLDELNAFSATDQFKERIATLPENHKNRVRAAYAVRAKQLKPRENAA